MIVPYIHSYIIMCCWVCAYLMKSEPYHYCEVPHFDVTDQQPPLPPPHPTCLIWSPQISVIRQPSRKLVNFWL